MLAVQVTVDLDLVLEALEVDQVLELDQAVLVIVFLELDLDLLVED